jgi:hypothetical protein
MLPVMAKPKHSSHILDLAKRGAEARLQDLLHEAKILVNLFPHLRDSYDKDELPISFIVAKGSGQLKNTDGRAQRKMSAAAKKAVSVRMKKYWAAKRKAAAKA